MSATAESCVTCGAPVETPYCATCGERRASDRSYSVWEFIRDHVIESVVSFDGKAVRTVKTLLVKPGELTVAFMRGVRLPYLAPLQLFFLLNLGFFLWSTATGTRIFDTPLVVHRQGVPYAGWADRLVVAQMAAKHMDEKSYTARFDALGAAQARSMIVAMVPAFAILVGVLSLGRRRFPIVQHVVYSLHFYAFLFVFLVVSAYTVDPLVIFTLKRLHVKPGFYGYDNEASLVAFVLVSIFIALSLRRAYDFGRIRSIAMAPVLAYGMYMVLQAYRGLVFFMTYSSM